MKEGLICGGCDEPLKHFRSLFEDKKFLTSRYNGDFFFIKKNVNMDGKY